MKISKVEPSKQIEGFIEEEQEKYEARNGVSCNYTPFLFVAKADDEVVGAIAGATCFSEVYIDELIVKDGYRGNGIGERLIATVENYYKDSGFDNMNACTNEFQAPKFYEKCGFELEFVRKNKDNPKLNKYFYIKHFQ